MKLITFPESLIFPEARFYILSSTYDIVSDPWYTDSIFLEIKWQLFLRLYDILFFFQIYITHVCDNIGRFRHFCSKYLQISMVNTKRFIFITWFFKCWLLIIIDMSSIAFMKFIVFIVNSPAMAYPYQGAVIKLWYYERSHNHSKFLLWNVSQSFGPTFLHILLQWGSISTVMPYSLTVLLLLTMLRPTFTCTILSVVNLIWNLVLSALRFKDFQRFGFYFCSCFNQICFTFIIQSRIICIICYIWFSDKKKITYKF